MTSKNERYNTAMINERLEKEGVKYEKSDREMPKPGSYKWGDLTGEPRGKKTPWKR